MASSGESSRRLHYELVSPFQLATHVMYDEEEVSLSQPKTTAPSPEEEEVPVPQGTSVVVPLEEEVPPEEEEVLAAPLVMVPPEGRGCLVPVPAMVSSSPFFFSQKGRRFFSPFFS
jgi:hypothetical protein